jgi:hypothetical protein
VLTAPVVLPQAWREAGVTACARAGNDLLLAIAGRGLVWVRLGTPERAPEGSRRWPIVEALRLRPEGVPTTLSGIAVARLAERVDVVYAVAGDDAVYRFSLAGEADQRITRRWGASRGGPADPVRRPARWRAWRGARCIPSCSSPP